MSQPTEDGIIVTFNEFMEHLQKHMEELKSEVVTNDRLYTAEDFPKLKAVVVEAASKMERNVSKLHLFYSSLTVDALIPLMKDTETVFVAVVQSARLFMSCGLTLAAKNEVIMGVEVIYEAMGNLIDHCKLSYLEKRPSLSPSMTGAVWDACKRLNGLSDSNRKACMKDVLRSVSLIRDVFKECNEFLENDDEDDWDGLLDDDDLEMLEGVGETAEEDYDEEIQKEIVAYIGSLKHLFEMIFKSFSGIPDVIPKERISDMDDLYHISHDLCDGVNNLGVMVYSAEKSDKEALHKLQNDLKKLEQKLIVVLGESTMDALKPVLNENMALLDKLIAKMA